MIVSNQEVNLCRLPLLRQDLPLLNIRTMTKVVLALIAHGFLDQGSIAISQRHLAMTFNRAQRKPVAKILSELLRLKLISIQTLSSSGQPHTYTLSDSVISDPDQLLAISNLAEVLYGTKGLVTDWRFNASWGHGALNASGTLIVSTLARVEQPMSVKELVQYLKPLINIVTARGILRKLSSIGIVQNLDGILSLPEDWETRLTHFLADSPSGDDRLNRANDVRRREWAHQRSYIADGGLSDFELHQLRCLPCVYCQGRATEQEHFPPQRFLQEHNLKQDRLHSWAVCRTCNAERSGFIRSLPFRKLQYSKPWHFKNEAEIPTLIAVNANFHLERFEQAFQSGDIDAAVSAIYATLNMMRRSQLLGQDLTPPRPLSPNERSRPRITTLTTADCQLRPPSD
jgi:hypothetical protein